MERKYLPTLAQLIDRLSIATLKSVKIFEHKDVFEKEAHEIMADIDSMLGPGQGQMIRAVQVNATINEMIWANESFVRKGEASMTADEIGRRLQMTHAMNRVRNQAMNVISNITGERKDLKLDYMDAEMTKKFGYDFGGILDGN